MARLSFRCGTELVERVDSARGDVPRERWLRRTVERYSGQLVGIRTKIDGKVVMFHPDDVEFVYIGAPTVERALSEAKEPSLTEQADPGSVSSSEGARSAAPAEQPASRAEMFRRATQR